MRASERALGRFDRTPHAEPQSPPRDRQEEIRTFLRTLDLADDDARRYLEIHMERISRTLTLTPPPGRTGRALELGTYMHMAPALARVFGYGDVRGAYFGPLGVIESKTVRAAGKEIFRCDVALFDAEKHPYPYDDGYFDLVLCCELIEHLLHDPMFMLFEMNRVLADGGALIVTTPNIASWTAVARLLWANGHPQLFSEYPNPQGEFADSEIPHVHEDTPQELEQALKAAGFQVEYLFTEKIAGYNSDLLIRPILDDLHLPTSLRGEQLYAVARKVPGAPMTRYPKFLYEVW